MSIYNRADRLRDRPHPQAEQAHHHYERDRDIELLKHFEHSNCHLERLHTGFVDALGSRFGWRLRNDCCVRPAVRDELLEIFRRIIGRRTLHPIHGGAC